MKYQIKNRFTEDVIFDGEYESMALCIFNAIKKGKNLSVANLSKADLSGANLSGADLSGANLSKADLSRAKGYNAFRVEQLMSMKLQTGKINAYKLVNEKLEGPFNGGVKYVVGKTVSCKDANTDENTQCGAGINVATLPWCIREYKDGYKILMVEFTSKDIATIPLGTDGKFRLHKCKVVKEVDLKEIGLKEK